MRPVGSLPPSKPPPARHRPGARSARREGRRHPIADHSQMGERTVSFHSWLQSLQCALTPDGSQGRQRQRRSPRAATYRPSFETLDERVLPSFVAAGTYLAGVNVDAVATGDFNGDGKLDLVTVNDGNHTVGVFLSNGDGTFQP